MRVCSHLGPAIGQQQFSVGSAGGNEVRPKYAATNYANPLSAARDGCASGWIVFELPSQAAVKELRFAFDNMGNGQPGSQPDAHLHFNWTLGR